MAWCVITYATNPGLRPWQSVVSFRANSGRMQESALWVSLALEASANRHCFCRAERVPGTTLLSLLAEHPA